MIIEYGFGLLTGGASWLLSLLPTWSSGQGVGSGIAAILGPVSTGATNLGAWIPWSVGASWMTITLGFYFTTLVIRAVKSFIPSISG